MRQPEGGIKSRFQMADWMVDPSLNRLEKDGASVRIEPRLIKLLCLLAEHAGNAVTKDMIFDTVWPDVYVGEESLSKAISELRRTLGDDRTNPRYIETVWKSGYRLLPDITVLSGQAPAVVNQRGGRLITIAAIFILLLTAGLWISLTPGPQKTYTVTPFTSHQGVEQSPAISPDGETVAFTWQEPGSDYRHIYLTRPGSDEYRPFTEGNAHHLNPAFSPDGSRLAYYRNGPDTGCDIMVRTLGENRATPVFACNPQGYPDLTWSPDGTKLAFSHLENDEIAHAIHILELKSSALRQVTAPAPTLWGDYDPAFSPDSKSIAFVRAFSEAMQDLYLVDIESGTETRLTNDIRNILGTAWEPSSDTILFASNRNGVYGLWQLEPVAGAAPSPIITGHHVRNPAVGPNGTTILFESIDNDVDFYSRKIDETAETVWAKSSSTYPELHPNISPNGTKIAFTSNRSGNYEIWVADMDGSNARQLTEFEGSFVAHPKWSPDGQTIAFDARPDGRIDIFTIRADGSDLTQITKDSTNNHAPTWTPDGRSLIFGSDRGGSWSLWQQGISNSTPVKIVDAAFYGQLSSDGTSLYYTKFATTGLWRRPITGGPEQQVFPTLRSGDWGNWGFADDELFYVERSGGTSYLIWGDERYPLTGTLPQIDPGIAVSPDGQTILHARFTRTDSDLMLATQK